MIDDLLGKIHQGQSFKDHRPSSYMVFSNMFFLHLLLQNKMNVMLKACDTIKWVHWVGGKELNRNSFYAMDLLEQFKIIEPYPLFS